ncbi:MAG: DEAD/DEAH box helicase family protein [Chthoniobacterales bacterium]
MRLSVYDKPRVIGCAHDYPNHIGLPRGCLDDLRKLLSNLKIKVITKDELYDGEPLGTSFRGELRPEQEKAAAAMLESDIGVLSATTAFGKTVVAAWMIAKRQVNTLVIVHRKQLQNQWIERLSSFLDLPKNSIGRIGGGRKKPTGIIDVAVIQSLIRKDVVDDLVSRYGHIIVDECHHLPARSFENVVRLAKARFITGLSATVTRKDGLHPIITMRCGPIRYRVNAKEQNATHPFEHTVLVRPTTFCSAKPPDQNLRTQFQDLYGELIADAEQNCLICDDIIQAVHKGRSPLVLTERNEHLDYLAEALRPKIQHFIILRGAMNRKAMTQAMDHLKEVPENETRVVLATGGFIGEGFDDARLDTLFITLPVSWRGTITQYVGRLHRLHDSKCEVQVYDYADLEVPMLERMFNRRCRTYESIGYKILLPASATTGWPAAIPLPVDPAWKINYSGTVRRLVRDGFDLELATQFTHLSSNSPEDNIDIDRARSATEAFLYRRLESLPETARRFQLNIKLPIPFDNLSSMEIDLLCVDAKIAIEIDGAQHLGDAEAYRRDRRKDLLLQENGYTVLRFLAEDVGKRLDFILDTILRALHRNTPSVR